MIVHAPGRGISRPLAGRNGGTSQGSTFEPVFRRTGRVDVDLIESFDGRYIPLVGADGFEATDVDTGRAIPAEALHTLLRVVATAGVLVPPEGARRSVRLRHKVGWAAAGFGACLLALGSFSVAGGAASRMRDLPPGSMPRFGMDILPDRPEIREAR